MISFDRHVFKDKVLIFCVVHYQRQCVQVALDNIISIIDRMLDLYMVLLDNNSTSDVRRYVDTIVHPKIDKLYLPLNIGPNNAVNYYIRDYIKGNNLPRIAVFLDPDVVFSYEDFVLMLDAITHLPKYGVLGLSYVDNACNPEMNMFFGSKAVQGTNKKTYHIRRPFLCPVSGGIMGFRGHILRDDLQYVPFHPRFLPRKYSRISTYGGKDATLFNALKWKYKHGYLANTCAVHMKNREGDIVDIPPSYLPKQVPVAQ